MSAVAGQFRVMRSASGNFQFAIGDVTFLLAQHDALTKGKPGRPDVALEVYKRAAIILIVTAWESYVEDTIRAVALERIREAKSPADLPKAFNACAHEWLKTSPRAIDVKGWTGDGWRDFLRARLGEELAALNTPNSENIKHLTARYLGFDLTTRWYWPSTSAKKSSSKLDLLIQLRGKLVHRGKEVFSASPVKRADVSDGIDLVKRLVKLTDAALPV